MSPINIRNHFQNLTKMKKLTCLIATAALIFMAGNTFAGTTVSRQPAVSVSSIIAGLQPGANYEQYAMIIRGLGRNIPVSEQAALSAWITGPQPSQFTDSQWLYLDNVVMDALSQQATPLPAYSSLLVAITTGTSYNSGLRDYALQHIADRLQPMSPSQSFETDPKQRAAMVKVMLQAAKNPGSDLAGTALQGLHVLLQARDYSVAHNSPSAKPTLSVSAATLRPVAVKLATASGVPMKTRMTALQVCSERGFGEVLSTSRSIAADSKQPATLRLSAIAAMGNLGDANDAQILNTLKNEPDSRFAMALRHAMKQLQQPKPATQQ